MNKPSLLVLVRHARSLMNEAKKGSTYFEDEEARKCVKGIPDHNIPINPEGVKQAELVGHALRKRFGVFDYAYNSGYLRTTQTLDKILSAYSEDERLKIKVRSNIFIRERDPGHAYDMTREEVDRLFPWLDDYWQTFGGFFACPPGGESLAQMVERVHLFINMLFRDRAGQKVLVVTHGGTLRCFRFLLERWTYDQALSWPSNQAPKNCGLTVYEYNNSEQKLVLREYNTAYREEIS